MRLKQWLQSMIYWSVSPRPTQRSSRRNMSLRSDMSASHEQPFSANQPKTYNRLMATRHFQVWIVLYAQSKQTSLIYSIAIIGLWPHTTVRRWALSSARPKETKNESRSGGACACACACAATRRWQCSTRRATRARPLHRGDLGRLDTQVVVLHHRLRCGRGGARSKNHIA